jgi:rRNA maturation endonuclease Nob1
MVVDAPNILQACVILYAFTEKSAPAGKTCPMCAETVQPNAKVCRYCGHNFELQTKIQRVA